MYSTSRCSDFSLGLFLQVFKSGVCGCLDYDLTQGDDYQTIFDTMYLMNYYLGDEDDDTKRKVVELICSSTINDGEFLQVRHKYGGLS